MPQPMRHGTLWLAGLALVCAGGGVRAQTAMHHTPAVSGVPHGVPYFCEGPTATAVLSGAWSDPGIWTAGHVPGAGDRVLVGSGQTVTYDVESDARVSCVDVRGRLTFRPDRSTRLTVGNLTVMDGGTIEIGTEAQPVRADVTAEVVIADQPINAAIDPDQIGTGLQGLGVIRMHGAVKTPTFVRLAEEPTAGATSLVLDAAVSGWQIGRAHV